MIKLFYEQLNVLPESLSLNFFVVFVIGFAVADFFGTALGAAALAAVAAPSFLADFLDFDDFLGLESLSVDDCEAEEALRLLVTAPVLFADAPLSFFFPDF